MPSEEGEGGAGGYIPAYARAPFVFAVARARALPGPILVRLMTDLEGSTSSNKALLHRMTAAGALELARAGRVGVYRMAGRLLRSFEAVRGDGALRTDAWDGRFHALIYDIPESRRRDRDRFLMAAQQVGYRTLRPGLLISPTDEHRTLDRPCDPGVLDAWISFAPHEIPQVVAQAWRVEDFRAEYDRAIATVESILSCGLEELADAQALRTMYACESLRTGLLLRDGALPAELVPPGWPAPRFAALVDEVERRLGPAVVAHVVEQIATSPHAALVEADLSWSN